MRNAPDTLPIAELTPESNHEKMGAICVRKVAEWWQSCAPLAGIRFLRAIEVEGSIT
jgi:hypothetical protein